jgi:hypothetical protein
VQQKQFLKYLTFSIVKNHFPMHLIESQWLKRFNLHLCLRVVLSCRKQFSKEILPKLVEKTKQLYVLLALVNYYYVTSFHLWMSKGAYDIFAFVINFLRV